VSSLLPAWLEPVREGAAAITAGDLTAFLPPDDAEPRRGAVLMLFEGETAETATLLLTERSHDMRSHPGQVSFPGGSIDPGETAVEAALREAEEETGLDSSGVEVFGSLPELWLPPSNFAVTPVLGWWHTPVPVQVVDPQEVHAIHLVPLAELLQADHRINARHPSGWVGPAFLIGPDRDVILWGFTAGVITRLFDYLGWATPWADYEVRDLPTYMLQGGSTRLPQQTPPSRRQGSSDRER
jgi:8-oxo-dGTP pyrophosphatase MutT (NUDIX family)